MSYLPLPPLPFSISVSLMSALLAPILPHSKVHSKALSMWTPSAAASICHWVTLISSTRTKKMCNACPLSPSLLPLQNWPIILGDFFGLFGAGGQRVWFNDITAAEAAAEAAGELAKTETSRQCLRCCCCCCALHPAPCALLTSH